MRTFTVPLALLCILNICLFAQRPWIKSAWPDVGTAPQLAVVSNTLMAFNRTAASSYDHGATWSPQPNITGPVRGIVDFPAVAGSIALTQTEQWETVHGFYTQNGSNWTHFDSLEIGGRIVTGVTTIGTKYFIGTNTNTIIVRGAVTTEVSVPSIAETPIVDIASTPEVLAVVTSENMQISIDEGLNWSEVHPDAGVPPSTRVTEICTINGTIYAASDYGVLRLQVSNASLQPVSNWPVEIGVPVVDAIAGDAQHVVALVVVNNQHQLFRLSISDTAWNYCAYPLPGVQPVTGVQNTLVIDNGWAVTNHQLHDGPADSAGVFRFDINDFTDVLENDAQTAKHIFCTENGLFIQEPPQTAYHIKIYDLLMRSIFECAVEGGIQSVSLPQWVNGYLCVVIMDSHGSTIRGIVIR